MSQDKWYKFTGRFDDVGDLVAPLSNHERRMIAKTILKDYDISGSDGEQLTVYMKFDEGGPYFEYYSYSDDYTSIENIIDMSVTEPHIQPPPPPPTRVFHRGVTKAW